MKTVRTTLTATGFALEDEQDFYCRLHEQAKLRITIDMSEWVNYDGMFVTVDNGDREGFEYERDMNAWRIENYIENLKRLSAAIKNTTYEDIETIIKRHGEE